LRQKLKIALPPLTWPVTALLLLASFTGCQAERRKTDAELGLSPTQAAGRRIFDRQCGGCHEAYSSRPLKGPSLQGLFKRRYLKNGMPANEERVREITLHGRSKMPAFGRALTPDQIDELIQYLNTL
jgi:mono/diheme cytochrome c family protein